MPENLSTICCQKDNMLAPSDRSASHAAQGRRYLNQVWALRRSADSFDKPGAFDGAAQHLVPTIFHEPWWLEIASDGCYREATVESLPYLVSRRAFGLTTVGTPLLTHVLGPALAANFSDRNAAHPMKQVSIIHDLIAQLPKAAHISFRLHGGFSNTLSFDAAGFANSASFTVEVAPSSPEAMWRQMRDKTRNVIRRAQERLTAAEMFDVATFLDFYDANLRDSGRINQYDRRVCGNIMQASLQHGMGRLIATSTPTGTLQSAIFTVSDRRAEYYFMSTRALHSMNGATSLAIWTAMLHAAEHGRVFDMDGLHVNNTRLPNLQLLTGFGGTIRPRYIVRRTRPIGGLAQLTRSFFKSRD
jgi:hypothetical protein